MSFGGGNAQECQDPGVRTPIGAFVTFPQYCGFYMSFQATQAICIMMQVEGKLTKEKVTRMLREKKLSEPAEIMFELVVRNRLSESSNFSICFQVVCHSWQARRS